EAALLVADGADRLAGDRLELGRIDHGMARRVLEDVAVLVLLQQRLGNAHLAGDDDAVGGRQRLAGHAHLPGVHAGLPGLTVHEVDDFVGYAVANLVRMSFRNRFAGEQIVLARHGMSLSKKADVPYPPGARPVKRSAVANRERNENSSPPDGSTPPVGQN